MPSWNVDGFLHFLNTGLFSSFMNQSWFTIDEKKRSVILKGDGAQLKIKQKERDAYLGPIVPVKIFQSSRNEDSRVKEQTAQYRLDNGIIDEELLKKISSGSISDEAKLLACRENAPQQTMLNGRVSEDPKKGLFVSLTLDLDNEKLSAFKPNGLTPNAEKRRWWIYDIDISNEIVKGTIGARRQVFELSRKDLTLKETLRYIARAETLLNLFEVQKYASCRIVRRFNSFT